MIGVDVQSMYNSVQNELQIFYFLLSSSEIVLLFVENV